MTTPHIRAALGYMAEQRVLPLVPVDSLFRARRDAQV